MKRVLCHLFFDEYPKDSRIRRYTNALSEKGYEVIIISLNNGKMKSYESYDNIHIYRINLSKKRGTFARRLSEYLLFEIIAFFYVIKIFFKFRPEIFHVHTLPDFLVFSTLVPKLFGAKIVLDFHELFPEAMLQFKKGLQKKSLWYKGLLLQEKYSFKFANEIISFHDPAKNILQSRYGFKKNVTTVMNGVDENELPVFNKITDKKFKIVYNGTINYNLNLSLVIKALINIKIKYPDIYNRIGFYLYGDGPDLDNILELAKMKNIENVYYCGRLNFNDMMKELESASLSVIPPIKDVYSDLFYSIKLIEMIFLKIPVAATRLNTYLQFYPEDCLLYFDSNNDEELADKIIFAFKNSDKMRIFTDKAFTEYKKYSWNIMKERYIKLIESISKN